MRKRSRSRDYSSVICLGRALSVDARVASRMCVRVVMCACKNREYLLSKQTTILSRHETPHRVEFTARGSLDHDRCYQGLHESRDVCEQQSRSMSKYVFDQHVPSFDFSCVRCRCIFPFSRQRQVGDPINRCRSRTGVSCCRPGSSSFRW